VDIVEATECYEEWLAGQVHLVAADLRAKHDEMAEDAFAFLRATFYRWARRWPEDCPDLAGAPTVLAVGDLHLANFGTWRDAEGRLAWGINDFDEADELPYTNDLVRLATSVVLADQGGDLLSDTAAACAALLTAYEEGLAACGRPIVLEEEYPALRALALDQRRDPARFWAKLDNLPAASGQIPPAVTKAIAAMLPEPGLACRVAHRSAGLGSLGRQRFVAVADWCGGRLAREAKALAPSAWRWGSGETKARTIRYADLLGRLVRCPDPWLRVHGRWVVRRLAPDCSRIELAELDKKRHEAELFRAMGWETANVHLGSPEAMPRIHDDLRRRPTGWLHEAAEAMAAAMADDWRTWRHARLDGRSPKDDDA
jgi:hypothetical protein